ncbi:gamma-glutamyl-gamma-aminobutyrate hydrolase family protein [Bacteriovoracaceae bacterium]|nr:gamma-glutamyl-gamma-aminobutyrate hydrolase family protein [Bacteriovoracaceae bacterium]
MTSQFPKTIAIVDGFVQEPVIYCFNRLVENIDAKLSYHCPAKMGIDSLRKEEARTECYIILGSASHMSQNLAWHNELASFMGIALDRKIPVLGICFGHQLMAHHFGATVSFIDSDERKVDGAREIKFEAKVGKIPAGSKLNFAVSHRQIVTNPGQILQTVGKSTDFSHDVVKHPSLPYLGIQPHPEASIEFCRKDASIQDTKTIRSVQTDGLFFIYAFLDEFFGS